MGRCPGGDQGFMTKLAITVMMLGLFSLIAILSRRIKAEEFMTGCAVAVSVLIIYAVLLAYVPQV